MPGDAIEDIFLEERREVEDLAALKRKHTLEDISRLAEGSKERIRLQKQYDAEEREARMEALQERIDLEEDYATRQQLKEQLHTEELAKRKEDNEKKLADAVAQKVFSTISSVNSAITSAAQTYSSYVDRIQTRLLGANETMSSISTKLMVAFGASPIFQMKQVMEKVAVAVEKGINFNVESRAAMEVLKDKVAATFDAFDSSLLRIVKIQQQDSTQARLGMESILTEFLNRNFQDSSYLANNINSQVTSALVEAESRLTRESAVQFEYAIQKWLGSFSSVGVSDAFVQKFAQGLGYLASGDVTSLSGQSDLETLLVASANRGGANYGQMLTNGVTVDDINAIFSGLRSLVEEIGNNKNNVVALNQYAKTFGLTVSDVQSLLNLGNDAMTEIASDMQSYSDLTQRVKDETSVWKLLGRTGGATIGDNLYQNFLWGSGRAYGSNVGSYMGWQMAGLVSNLLQGLESGVDIQPFGVGTHLNLDIGKLAEIAQFTAGVLPGIASMLGGITSIGGVGWSVLGDDQEEARGVVQKGNLQSFAEEGTRESAKTYSGDYSEGALATTSGVVESNAKAEHTDESFDEEKKKTEAMVDSMKEIGDNVKFIVQLLNESGIVIRGRYGYTDPSSLFNDTMTESDGARLIGVEPV